MYSRSERPSVLRRRGIVALLVAAAMVGIGGTSVRAQEKEPKKQASRGEDRPRAQRARPGARRPGARPGRARGNGDSPRGRLSTIARQGLEEARVGVYAPELHLPLLKDSLPPAEVPAADGKIKLSDYRGKKPVVLIFGSYT